MKLRTVGRPVLSAVLALCFIAPRAQCQNSESATLSKSSERPLNMLVLGDSIMWGQGLRPESKAWYQIKLWLAEYTGRPVIERVEAHSGAVIDAQNDEERLVSADGEVNVGFPTIINQVERASRYYLNGPTVDLVLVNGCGNDVGVQNVLNAANTTQEIRLLTEAKCGRPMEKLLRKISAAFPTAYVIVSGYYPFVSEKTRNDLFMRALTKRFYKVIAGAPHLSQEIIFKRLIANADEWYRSSNKSLGAAVKTVNAELGATNRQLMFAEIHFLPEHSFRAPKTQLWNFESSPLRKMLVILSFGKILLRPNDEMRKQRAASCKQFWKPAPGETPSQRKERKNEELLCRYAALGHPNRQGALTYTLAITDQVRTMFPVLGLK